MVKRVLSSLEISGPRRTQRRKPFYCVKLLRVVLKVKSQLALYKPQAHAHGPGAPPPQGERGSSQLLKLGSAP